MAFTHLHVHTQFSLLDGSSKIGEITQRAKELGQDSLAITDHGNMYGVIDFYRAARKISIKPILGCEVYVAPGSRFDKEIGVSEDRYYHLILLAETNEGYANLMKIVSAGFVEGFYYKPRVDYEVLEKYHEGIICLSACLAGEVQKLLSRNLYEEACQAALRYQEIFGKGNYFLELQDHGIPEQRLVNQLLLRMHEDLQIDLVATNDVHYTFAEDAEAHDVLLCIQTGKKVQDEDRMRYEGGQFYLKSEEEMKALFPYALEALENTHKIAERCNVEIEFGVTKLPHFEVPEGFDSWTYLNHLCDEGLKRRYGAQAEELRERLDYELNVIKTMGYVDYFLIVWDFINYSKEHGIAVGPGRGSAAGSIVSYCLAITDIDPIRYNLLFERFLNPERVSMPDIDVDFCYERRPEVIDYVMDKYGKDRVVQIVTFGTMAARGVIKDVGRAMDISYAKTDMLAKMVPNELGITLEGALKMNTEFREIYEQDPEVHNLIDTCMRLEGLPRHTSMHAAGVVIGSRPLDEFVPLSCGGDGTVTTQFTMTTIEELGLLKMDFLGLRTLTVIQNAERLVNASLKKKDPNAPTFRINDIDYNEKNVLGMIGTGRCEGVFQLESAGMKSFMKELKPNSLEDLIAGISLYRPGPMDFIPQYIEGKSNPEAVKYATPELEPILADTYGCIVYQEQVMRIVRDLAGYTMGRSDLVRRAMSKKKQHVMEVERHNFVYGNPEEGVPGCVAKGIPAEVADKIYDSMMTFAQYAFNKSHAACYAYVSFQTAYLKYYYPVEFMAALMTSVIDNISKVSQYIMICRQMGIQILPPDINESEGVFSVSDGAIRYGLNAIKSLGRPVIEALTTEREEHGKFTDLKDFTKRLSGREVNKRTLENLIKAGACDSFGLNRRQMMYIYSDIMDDVAQEKKSSVSGQMSLFDMMEPEDAAAEISVPNVEEYPQNELLSMEKEVLGVYVSGHPLNEFQDLWTKNITNQASDFELDEETNEPKVKDKEQVVIGGIISQITTKLTKSGQQMAFISIEDLVGTVEVLLFPKSYAKVRDCIVQDRPVFVLGRASVEADANAKLIGDKLIPFDEIPRDIWIKFADKATYDLQEITLKELIDSIAQEALKEQVSVEQVGVPVHVTNGATDRVVIYCEAEKAKKFYLVPKGFRANAVALERMRSVFGAENVKVVEKSIEK